MLVTGEDAVLITAGVVGSVVDVGTREYGNRGQGVRIPKSESKDWRHAYRRKGVRAPRMSPRTQSCPNLN